MIPYTYLIKHIPTNKYYYGVRFKKGCHPNDLWIKYFTSSKKVKGLIRKYGKKSFKFEVRKTFKTIKQAINWEHKVLRRMKVISRKDFLNQSDSKTINFWQGKKLSEQHKKRIGVHSKGKNNPRYGIKLSKKQKKQISESLKKWFKNPKNKHPWLGKKHSKKTITLLKKLNKGKNNPNHREFTGERII